MVSAYLLLTNEFLKKVYSTQEQIAAADITKVRTSPLGVSLYLPYFLTVPLVGMQYRINVVVLAYIVAV